MAMDGRMKFEVVLGGGYHVYNDVMWREAADMIEGWLDEVLGGSF